MMQPTMAAAEATEIEGPATFEGFYQGTYERLVRSLYLVTGDPGEAEDLAQEAFVRIYERWDKVRTAGNPEGYLYRTALNTHRSRLRRLAVAARRTVHARSEDEVQASDDRDAIRRALQGLPDGQRYALILVDWLGMTDAEAGATLRTSAGAVRNRVMRARKKLRTILGGELDD